MTFLADIDDLLEAFAVAVLAHVIGSANVYISPVDPAIHRQPGVVQIGADMRQEFEFWLQFSDGLDRSRALRAGDRRRKLHVFDPELVEQSGDFALVFDREVRAAKLLALAQGGVDEIEALDGNVSVVHGDASSHLK